MKKHLCIDCGNTHAKAALFDGDEVVAEVMTGYDDLSPLVHFASGSGACAALMSSTSHRSAAVAAAVSPLLSCPLGELTHLTPLPLTIGYRTPATLGRDRIAAAVGAWQLFTGSNVLVVDAGTCITLDVVTATGVYLGGNIAPGVEMRLKAMHDYTSRLPLADISGEVPLVGYDTDTALRSGAVLGAAAEVEGTARAIKAVTGQLKVMLTGGSAELLSQYLGEINVGVEPHLVLRGLNAIIGYNE